MWKIREVEEDVRVNVGDKEGRGRDKNGCGR